MKALSVVETAGDLIANGNKTLEIRKWVPDSLPLLNLAIVQNKERLTVDNPFDPNGVVVAIVDIMKVRKWEPKDAKLACSQWEAGWFAWELENIRKIAHPIPAHAKRKIYKIDYYIKEINRKLN